MRPFLISLTASWVRHFVHISWGCGFAPCALPQLHVAGCLKRLVEAINCNAAARKHELPVFGMPPGLPSVGGPSPLTEEEQPRCPLLVSARQPARRRLRPHLPALRSGCPMHLRAAPGPAMHDLPGVHVQVDASCAAV